MSDLHKAAAAALEALEGVLDTYGEPLDLLSISGGAYEALQCRDAITALRAALAEPVQEAACHVFNVTVTGNLHEWEPTTFAFALRDGKHALFTAPQSPQRKPLDKDALIDEFCKTPDIHQFVSAFVAGARYAERAHGIGREA